MSSYQTSRFVTRSFRSILQSFQNLPGLSLSHHLSERDIEKAFDDAECSFGEGDDDIYTPAVTLWAFLSQMLFSGAARSCNAASQRVRTFLATMGRSLCSFRSGAFCKARPKIKESVPLSLIRTTATRAEQKVKDHWKWNGRSHVYLVDGAEVTGEDTEENQAEYPQPESQATGLGFPMMRVVVLTSFITAMVRAVAVGPYSGKETGENALLRQLFDEIPEGSVVVGDQYYCSYFMMALMKQRGIDVVTRLTVHRTFSAAEKRKAKRMKNGDYLVTWERPRRPDWMDEETYATIPKTLAVRLVHVNVKEKGFRSRKFYVATTLLSSKRDPSESLAELYRERWNVELDLNSLKTRMGLDRLRAKTPHMLRLELTVGILAYNLIRSTMMRSAGFGELTPREISFSAALTLISTNWLVCLIMDEEILTRKIRDDLLDLQKHRVAHRDGRIEPRAVKRRPKPYPRLKTPRKDARKNILKIS